MYVCRANKLPHFLIKVKTKVSEVVHTNLTDGYRICIIWTCHKHMSLYIYIYITQNNNRYKYRSCLVKLSSGMFTSLSWYEIIDHNFQLLAIYSWNSLQLNVLKIKIFLLIAVLYWRFPNRVRTLFLCTVRFPCDPKETGF